MFSKWQLSRRNFLAASGSAAFVSCLHAASAYSNVPVIPKRVERLFKIQGCKEPDDLQFGPDGTLWVLDQVDPNKVFRVHPEDGSVIEQDSVDERRSGTARSRHQQGFPVVLRCGKQLGLPPGLSAAALPSRSLR